jgi:hypothetical protein
MTSVIFTKIGSVGIRKYPELDLSLGEEMIYLIWDDVY